jgi:hypothetical protein
MRRVGLHRPSRRSDPSRSELSVVSIPVSFGRVRRTPSTGETRFCSGLMKVTNPREHPYPDLESVFQRPLPGAAKRHQQRRHSVTHPALNKRYDMREQSPEDHRRRCDPRLHRRGPGSFPRSSTTSKAPIRTFESGPWWNKLRSASVIVVEGPQVMRAVSSVRRVYVVGCRGPGWSRPVRGPSPAGPCSAARHHRHRPTKATRKTKHRKWNRQPPEPTPGRPHLYPNSHKLSQSLSALIMPGAQPRDGSGL